MGLSINTIIVLENKEEYLTLNEAMYYGKKYFLTMKLKENREVDTKEVVILEENISGFDTYVIKVTDKDILSVLTRIFKAQREIK